MYPRGLDPVNKANHVCGFHMASPVFLDGTVTLKVGSDMFRCWQLELVGNPRGPYTLPAEHGLPGPCQELLCLPSSLVFFGNGPGFRNDGRDDSEGG